MKSIIVLLLFCNFAVLSAQPLSEEKALSIAEQLYQKKFLNKAGRRAMIKGIRAKDLLHDGITSYGINPNYTDGRISKQTLLLFCHNAFVEELFYRNFSNVRLSKSKRKGKRSSSGTLEHLTWISDDSIMTRKQIKRRSIEAKILTEDSSFHGWSIYPPMSSFSHLHHYIDKSRSTLGKTRSRTAKDLFFVGLIDEQMLAKINSGIADGSVGNESGVCYAALELLRYPIRKASQLAFLDSLTKRGLLPEAENKNLKNSYVDFELLSDMDILSRCHNSLILHTKDYPNSIDFYREAFHAVNTIIPDFEYTDLQLTIDSTQYIGVIRYDVTIRFISGGKVYSHSFEYPLTSSDSSNVFLSSNVALSDFYEGINTWLLEHESDRRLYKATPDFYDNDDRVGLILLTEKQRDGWLTNDFSLSLENTSRLFSAERIEETIKSLDSIGLLSTLTRAQKDSVYTEIKKRPVVTSAGDLLRYFPNLTVISDSKIKNPKNPYEDLCENLSKISHGKFNPHQINDTFGPNIQQPEKEIHFSFQFNGKQYKTTIQKDGDLLDPGFIYFITQVLKKNGVSGNFYAYTTLRLEWVYVFLEDSQLETFRKLFPEQVIDLAE